jgi:hypothetical protein
LLGGQFCVSSGDTNEGQFDPWILEAKRETTSRHENEVAPLFPTVITQSEKLGGIVSILRPNPIERPFLGAMMFELFPFTLPFATKPTRDHDDNRATATTSPGKHRGSDGQSNVRLTHANFVG